MVALLAAGPGRAVSHQSAAALWELHGYDLEPIHLTVLEREGIYGFRLQTNLGKDEWIGRVDFSHERYPVVLEVQSDKFHSALTDQRRDAIRHARLVAAGFLVVEIWESDIWYNPDRWLNSVRIALQDSAA